MNVSNLDLGDLADPAYHTEPLDLRNHATNALMAQLHKMILIRRAEETIADLALSGEAKCPCHLCIGQEAAAVGVASALRSSDRLYGGHRSHSQFLAMGGSVDGLLAEVLGKETGCSGGMGGSMHLVSEEHGFGGCVPIVAGTVPIAVGAAMAFKQRKTTDVAVAFFGDGACEEGVVQESLNLAASMGLPVIFVVENNLFASHLDIQLRQAGNRTARFAEANGIPAHVVDGNDCISVHEAAAELVGHAREGKGPGFLEAVTYRWRGHVGPDENTDVGLRRSAEEIQAWKKRDPIARLEASLVTDRQVDAKDLSGLRDSVDANIAKALSAARAAGFPDDSVLMNYVYSR